MRYLIITFFFFIATLLLGQSDAFSRSCRDAYGNYQRCGSTYTTKDAYGNYQRSDRDYTTRDAHGNFQRNKTPHYRKDAHGNGYFD